MAAYVSESEAGVVQDGHNQRQRAFIVVPPDDLAEHRQSGVVVGLLNARPVKRIHLKNVAFPMKSAECKVIDTTLSTQIYGQQSKQNTNCNQSIYCCQLSRKCHGRISFMQ